MALAHALQDNLTQKEQLLRVQLATSLGKPPVSLLQQCTNILSQVEYKSNYEARRRAKSIRQHFKLSLQGCIRVRHFFLDKCVEVKHEVLEWRRTAVGVVVDVLELNRTVLHYCGFAG